MHYMYYIDIVNRCNLACPLRASTKSGRITYMDINIFKEIVQKIVYEQTDKEFFIGLYNWSEPFLNKNIAKFTNYLNELGVKYTLSTNFALPRIDALEAVILDRPYSIAVSVSGFYQQTYSLFHRGGGIDNVKQNLQRAREIMDRRKIDCYLAVKWLANAVNDEEKILMQNFADSLNFSFEINYACPINFHEIILYQKYGIINKAYSLLLPYNTFPQRKIFNPELINNKCVMHNNVCCIDVIGDVYLCCVTPLKPEYKICSFLSTEKSIIMDKLNLHNFCQLCKGYGYNQYQM